ncbi:actin remodeling regulator NHS-like [Betta splendens]|uniref:Actin remodeling regulator NHS-like n=1 Tax=Betta splendens TaxID=158456 RepID=A0A9W2XPM5_BETSP|nr:actin remodeling regulator NHS-like [Betta splendens]
MDQETGTASAGSFISLNEHEQRYYSGLHSLCQADTSGKLSSSKVAELFKASQLPPESLHKVTELCGAKRLGYFGTPQFYAALKLLAAAQSGLPVRLESLTANLPLPRFIGLKNDPEMRYFTIPPGLDAQASQSGTVPGPGPGSASWTPRGERSSFRRQDSNVERKEPWSPPRSPNASPPRSPGPYHSYAYATQRNGTDPHTTYESKHPSHPGLQLEQHSSPSNYGTKPTAELPAVARASSAERLDQQSVVEYSDDDPWRITEEQLEYYTNQFKSLQPDLDALILGTVAKNFFTKSKLPIPELSHIWELSDVDRDGALTFSEFCTAFHLIVARKNGYPLPESLPPALWPGLMQQEDDVPDTPESVEPLIVFEDAEPGPSQMDKGILERLQPSLAAATDLKEETHKRDSSLQRVTAAQEKPSLPLPERPEPPQELDPQMRARSRPRSYSSTSFEDAVKKAEEPPTPPPRPQKTHSRASSLDLNKLFQQGAPGVRGGWLPPPPALPPRPSTSQVSHFVNATDATPQKKVQQPNFADFSLFREEEETNVKAEEPAPRSRTGPRHEDATVAAKQDVIGVSHSQAPQKPVRRKYHPESQTPKTLPAPAKPAQRLLSGQKREIQMAIRKNRETNAVLTRLNSELQQQLKVVHQERVTLESQLELLRPLDLFPSNMPFAKRAVEPQLLCRYRTPNEERWLFEDLLSISNVALSRTLRQLSDLARHACSLFQELEDDLASTSLRVGGLQRRLGRLQQTCSELDPKQEAVPVSNLDVESKLTSHYQSPWQQQRNVLHPCTRPACVEELHRRANHSLWPPQRDPQRRRSGSGERRVTISTGTAPPVSAYPSPQLLHTQERATNVTTQPEGQCRDATTHLVQIQVKREEACVFTTSWLLFPHPFMAFMFYASVVFCYVFALVNQFESHRSSSPTECCHFSPWSRKAAPSDPDTDGVSLGHRSRFPIPNIPSTLDKQTNWSKALPLPTPEERMKSSSQVITSCVIPINVTGLGFDRDASVRCSLVHSQSVLQRRRKLRRRRTVAGIPRQVQLDLDSDDSPSSRERTVIVHASPDITPSNEELAGHLSTRDSGCQTEDFLTSGAPSRRRIRAQRGQGLSLSLSYSAGNISSLPDSADGMFTASVGARLRSRSLPRDSSRMMDNGRDDSDDEEELSPFDAEDFLRGPGKDEEESTDDQAMSEHQLGLKYKQLSECPEHSWMERARAQLPRKADMGSCEISSSSDTFSSPVHSVSAAGVLGGQLDHKEDHQSSSGNWSGSNSTCPSQTSETIPPAASPQLTGSSHCDSELSLNTATHTNDEQTGFTLDHYQGLRTQRAGSFSSTAMDILEEAGVSTPTEGEWSYTHPHPSRSQDLSPEPSREVESSLGCPSFTSMATCESSYSDKPLSEKADTVSHYSVDTEGYYTSMHFDCGLKGSKSFTYNYAASTSDCGLSDMGHMTLSRRCLSLRKPKVKPCPPKRSSSLRKICSDGNIPDKKEPKITCGQQLPLSTQERRLQLALSGSPHHRGNGAHVREPPMVWGAESSSDLTDLGVLSSTDAHSFKDEGVVQSDYADLWLLNDLKSSDPYRSLSNSSTATGTTVIECIKSQESSESQTSQSGSRATTPSLPSVEGDFKLTSPEKLAALASPSSGYSSQSETPTSSFPSAFFPGPLSPSSGKRKPKVPERKSSLSSLSFKDGAAAKKDLELPVTPPSHLDLNGLASVCSKASAYRTQTDILQQTQQRAAASAKPAAATNAQVFNVQSMSITPTVLHSVQLRPISKEHERSYEDKTASGPKCPTVNLTSTLLSSKSLELKRPLLNHSHHRHVPCTPAFTLNKVLPGGKAACESEDKREAEAPSESPTACGLQPEPPVDGADPATDEETSVCSEDGSLQSESPREAGTERAQEEPAQQGGLHRAPNGPTGPEQVPATEGRWLGVGPVVEEGISTEEDETSGVSATSASVDGKEASTPETQDHCSKDSTSSETSPLSDDSRPEDDSVFLSPTRTRTTEDLFAMIHRSKRKVLGRKDSNELSARNRLSAASANTPPGSTTSSPVPSVTPPSPLTSPGPQRVSGPIYRNAKRSSTSNEEFKLLLLRKGSRSDSSYRMSATEILKSPVAPKSPGDPQSDLQRQPDESGSPLQQQQQPFGPDQLSSPYPKANTEGFSPKAFSLSGSSRQGRSRIPPPANSSRYSMRSRLYSAPMQAISEGETENSDGSPHDDRSSQGST